jgi:nucleoside-diphosphate-sugar epimerase
MQHSGIGQWVRDNHCVGWGAGEHPLPLVLVDDVADALARAAAHPGGELDQRTWNLASRVPLSAKLVVAGFRERTGRALVFHPRSLALSQAIEILKWLVKRAGGRRDAGFPSWRDLKSRSLSPALTCRTARDVLHWQPCEDPRAFLDRALAARPPR